MGGYETGCISPISLFTGFRGLEKADGKRTGTERVLEARELSAGVAAPRTYDPGDSCWADFGKRYREKEAALISRLHKGPVTSHVFIHGVTAPRGPGTLKGLGSSDLI